MIGPVLIFLLSDMQTGAPLTLSGPASSEPVAPSLTLGCHLKVENYRPNVMGKSVSSVFGLGTWTGKCGQVTELWVSRQAIWALLPFYNG